MNSGIPYESYFQLSCGTPELEKFTLPQNIGSVSLSTLYEIGNSDLLHYHDEPHLTFILNGGVLDKRKNIADIKDCGEMMFFHAGEPHQTINQSYPTKYITLQFESAFLSKNSTVETAVKSSIEKNAKAKFNLLKIYKEMAIADKFSPSSLEMLFYNLIDESNVVRNGRPNWLNKVVELLHENWNLEISLDELSLAADVHPKTISKYFPKHMNCTLGEYRRRIKIEKSFSMIKSSKTSLTDVAYDCGFYDQSHFTATFKQLTGFRPMQFKNL
jgi:AraC family transcriptional regulator